MRKKKPLPLLENIEITAVAAEGKALARVDDRVVFVPFVVPGDVCDLQVTRKKNSYMEATAVRIHKRSELRAEPFCPHFGVCGGCKWQCLKYEEQLRAKQQQVQDALQRIGKVELPEISPILGSKHIREYRNKLEFGFSNRRWLTDEEVKANQQYDVRDALGFHITGAFDKILDITECHLMDDVQNRIRNDIRQYALQHGLSFYDLRLNQGLLRSLMVRNSNTGELMLLVQFRIETPEERQQAMALMQHLADTFPEITSLLYVDNHKCNDTFGDQEVVVFKGEDHIYEEMEGLKFKVGPKSF
jgi:23S rRNA (uracil1939-C5)-methyltransferase